jgi:hypothetical protein
LLTAGASNRYCHHAVFWNTSLASIQKAPQETLLHIPSNPWALRRNAFPPESHNPLCLNNAKLAREVLDNHGEL